MKKRLLGMLVCMGICTASLAAAGIVSYAAESTAEATETASERERGRRGGMPPKDDGSITAKISTVSEDTLTVFTEEKPEKPADGETPPEKPADGETPPEKPADRETPREKPADGDTSEQSRQKRSMNFSSEATTLTVTSSTVITKGREHEEASLSDLAADSIVRLVLDGTTVTSIDIME